MMSHHVIKNMDLVWFFLWMMIRYTSSHITPTRIPILASSNHTELGDDLCVVKSPLVPRVLSPWLETPQPTQGCSVPYPGLQGHGQHPEEVHVIHLMEVGRWNPSESDKPREVVKIWLDAASCPKSTLTQRLPLLRHTRQATANFEADKQNPSDDQPVKTKQHTLHRIHRVADIPVDDASYRHKRGADSVQPPASMVALLGPGVGQLDRKNGSSNLSYKGRPLILVLLTDQTVNWQINFGNCWHKQLASKIQVVVNRGSTVEANFGFEVTDKVWGINLSSKTVQRFVRRTYHGVASYTQIQFANFIRIRVGAGGPADTEASRRRAGLTRNKMNACDFNSRQNSLTVSAFLVSTILAQGCIRGEHEQNLPNVYMVDLKAQEIPFSKLVKKESYAKVTTKNKYLPSVVIMVKGGNRRLSLENSTNFTPDSDVNNITIILCSNKPVRWLLHTDQLHNNMVVVSDADSVVENVGIGTSSGLDVRALVLPRSRSALIAMILSEFGTPLLYAQMGSTTGLTLHLDENPEKEPFPDALALVNFTTPASPDSVGSSPLQEKSMIPNFLLPPHAIERQTSLLDLTITSANELGRHRMNRLEANMTVSCGKSHVEVAFPVDLLLELGVHHLHFNDRSCSALYNRTHASLSSLITSCGSTSHSDGKSTAFSNYVHVQFFPPNIDDEDVEGSGTSTDGVDIEDTNRVPIVCRYDPLLASDDVLDEGKDDIVVEGSKLGNAGELFVMHAHVTQTEVPSLYQLELYQDPLISHGLRLGSRSADFPGLQVDFDEKIYVQAWMDGVTSVQLVTENCWISNQSQAEGGMLKDRIVLIRASCPFHHSVKLGQESMFPGSPVGSTAASFFSFRVSEEYATLGQVLFVHCLIGVCAAKPKHTRGNLVLCLDPQQYCSQRARHPTISKAHPAAQQLLTRGPIIIPRKQQHTTHVNIPSAVNCGGMGFLSPEDIEAVITIDLVVMVAVCSFIIGVGLTAALWCIHSKTDPWRRQLHSGEHSLASRSAATGSSLSPHSHSGCSSMNSQSAIAT